MDKLNLPEYDHKIITEKDKKYIFDRIRNKYLKLTPEEWVRQNFIQYLIHDKKYPSSLISLEAEIKFNGLARRYDALIYSRNGSPLMLLEFKAPGIKINQAVFDQITQYNNRFLTPYLSISNGMTHFCCRLNSTNNYEFLKEIPEYDLL